MGIQITCYVGLTINVCKTLFEKIIYLVVAVNRRLIFSVDSANHRLTITVCLSVCNALSNIKFRLIKCFFSFKIF